MHVSDCVRRISRVLLVDLRQRIQPHSAIDWHSATGLVKYGHLLLIKTAIFYFKRAATGTCFRIAIDIVAVVRLERVHLQSAAVNMLSLF
jgi:hypothetical protein